MNRKKYKKIKRQAELIAIEWLYTLVSDEEAKKITLKNHHRFMPVKSYFNQDKTKRSELPREIIPVKILIDKLIKNNYKCSYCNQNVKIIYDKVRDPLQWTLDRIDNSMGHNTNNVVVSCLECNLKRRNQNMEKFLFTKSLKLTKIE